MRDIQGEAKKRRGLSRIATPQRMKQGKREGGGERVEKKKKKRKACFERSALLSVLSNLQNSGPYHTERGREKKKGGGRNPRRSSSHEDKEEGGEEIPIGRKRRGKRRVLLCSIIIHSVLPCPRKGEAFPEGDEEKLKEKKGSFNVHAKHLLLNRKGSGGRGTGFLVNQRRKREEGELYETEKKKNRPRFQAGRDQSRLSR